MNSQTTSTAWTVLKYAQSYAKPDQMTVFTNPTIRVIMDTRKNGQQLESMRLRVLWENANDANVQPYVYEDLELLSFSMPNASAQIGSLPLKVMYRDTTVGIRYHYPREPEPGKAPGTRRFQVTFATTHEASQFIANIEHVCVCKLSPQPNTRPANTNVNATLNPARLAASVAVPPKDKQGPPPIPERSHDPVFSSDPLISADVFPRTDQLVPPSSLPPSSLPRDQNQNASQSLLAGADTTSATTQKVTAKEFMAELRKGTSIHDLSDEELEKAIGEAIRDPGFLALMERLDKMWRAKGLIGV